jgi:hypothetical protein
MGWYGLDSPGSGYGAAEDSFEDGDEPSGFVKCWDIFSSSTIGGF